MSFTRKQIQTTIGLLIGLSLAILSVALSSVLMPFITAAILAYILNPLVDRLCQIRSKKWQLPRQFATCVALVALLSCVLAIVLIVLPVVQKEIPLLQDQIPKFFDQLNVVLAPKLYEFGIDMQLDSASIKQMLSDHLAGSGQKIMTSVLASVKVGGTAVFGLIANALLVPMVLYYLLVDWHTILRRLGLFVPRRWADKATELAKETDDLLAQYLRGQLLVMVILAVYYSSVLALAGFSAALPVGILTGLLVFIPYIGFGIGLCLALISAVLQFEIGYGLLMVAIIYGIGQVIESFYLVPRLVGERIGLSPLVVIFALLAFGQLFGFVGVLLALPASAIVSVGYKHLRVLYYESRFYTDS